MIQTTAELESIERFDPETARLTLLDPSGLAQQVEPGQFLNVRVRDLMDPLFRRPFSVFDVQGTAGKPWRIQIVFKVVGRGTSLLYRMQPGDALDLIGPCGRGFQYEDLDRTHMLVGGGMGGAPLHLLARKIIEKHGKEADLTCYLGARNAGVSLFPGLYEDLGRMAGIRVATEDGSEGYHGVVTKLLDSDLSAMDPSKKETLNVYACGPMPMLQALDAVSKKHSLWTQVSIEKRMACGMGVCYSCVCKVDREAIQKNRNNDSYAQFENGSSSGYALTCIDGPVFSLEEVVLDEP